MAGRLANLTPDLISDTSFEVVADNPTVLQDLNKYKRRIEEHLRQKLHNSHVEMILRERQEEDHRKAYSPVEQVQQMCDRNPAMRLLLQEFGLTLN